MNSKCRHLSRRHFLVTRIIALDCYVLCPSTHAISMTSHMNAPTGTVAVAPHETAEKNTLNASAKISWGQFLPRDASAERGYEIACRPSVCLSVTFRYRVQIGWNSSRIISRPNSLRPLLWLTPNIGDLVQREHPQN